MTGYGKAEDQINDKNIRVEIRSLNSKNLDLKVRIPSEYKEKETGLRTYLAKKLKRGKVDFVLQVDEASDRPKNRLNKEVIQNYLAQIEGVEPGLSKEVLMPAILRLPDVLKQDEEEISPDEWQAIEQVIEKALDNFWRYRKDEGEAMEKDLQTNIQEIQQLLEQIDRQDKGRIEKKKKKIRSELDQLKTDIDENRFEQELIYYLEKFDINEEKVRLKNHLDYFVKEFQSPAELKGKKLGFISQEIGREINTIGSKANDSDIQQNVVKMKDALEKIKEQLLNIL
jgi:uncharacterized protein (TIGR00255 family)